MIWVYKCPNCGYKIHLRYHKPKNAKIYCPNCEKEFLTKK
jgi:predicted RNA-binding Zn-ribbon protein involved in translation (DUF1610 family)